MSTLHTKERILDAAEEIMWTRSFHAVGLNEILGAVGVPKGSFYHYFKSKENFGVEMLKHYIAKATEEKHNILLAPTTHLSPVGRVIAMLEESIERFVEKNYKCPCLVLKLASEVTDLSEPMREVLANGMITWLEILNSTFTRAQEMGEISAEADPLFEAKLIRDLWGGAIQRATIMKSTEPMLTALAHIRNRIASPQASGRILQTA